MDYIPLDNIFFVKTPRQIVESTFITKRFCHIEGTKLAENSPISPRAEALERNPGALRFTPVSTLPNGSGTGLHKQCPAVGDTGPDADRATGYL